MAPHNHTRGSPFAPSDSPEQTPNARLPDTRSRIAVAFAFTTTILLAQTIGAALMGSLAPLTDTVHMITGAPGLLMALVAATLAQRPPSFKRTWGCRRAEVLTALAQATVLAGVGVYVIVEAVGWLHKPPDMPSETLVVPGVVSPLGDVASVLTLTSARRSSLNTRTAFLEMTNDALGSLSVIVMTAVIATMGWQRTDAVAGLFITALILPRTIKLIGEAGTIPVGTIPRGSDLDEIYRHMLGLDRVLGVHDLHTSTVATGLPVISAYVVVSDDYFQDGHTVTILGDLRTCMAGRFDVATRHSTFQLEARSASQRESGIHAYGYADAASRNTAHTPNGS